MDKGKFSKRFLESGPTYDLKGRVLNKFDKGERLRNTGDLEHTFGRWVHHATPDDLKSEDVPKKLVQDIDVEMSPLQQQHYNFVMQKVPANVRNTIRKGLPVDRKEAFHILPMLTQARNVANGVHYMSKEISHSVSAEITPKMHRALNDIQTHIRETPDAQVVVHSHMLEGGVDVMSAGLKARGISHAVFSGRIKDEERQRAVKDYNAGKIKALVISSAGTTGLNLPNTTLHVALDGHYNPAVTDQIEARGIRAGGQAHRPKENRQVMVRRYRSVHPSSLMNKLGITKKDMTVDEWIYGIAGDKQGINSQAEELLKKTAGLLDKLKADLKGEQEAISMYQRHIDTIKSPAIVSKLKEIRDEELHHAKEINDLLDKEASEVSEEAPQERLYFLSKSNIAGAGKGLLAVKRIEPGTDLGVGIQRIGKSGNNDKDMTRTELGTYTNHSDTPNLAIVKGKGEYRFIAKKPIEVGGELTANYNDFDFDGKKDFDVKVEKEEAMTKAKGLDQQQGQVDPNQQGNQVNTNVASQPAQQGNTNVDQRAKIAAQIAAYHYTRKGSHPMNILNYSDEEQERILKSMRDSGFSRGEDYIKVRKFVERALSQEAKAKLGDKVKVDHPL